MVESFALCLPKQYDDDLFRKLMPLIDRHKQMKISKYHRWEDVFRSLLGDVLARYVINVKTNLPIREVVFCQNSYGKPYVKGITGLHFNISHSGNWVVCAVGSAPVGVDIERIADSDLSIAKRFFTKREYKWLYEKNDQERKQSFYKLWTMKESYIKAVGKGLSIPLESFEIIPDLSVLITVMANGLDTGYRVNCHYIDCDHVFSVCSKTRQFCEKVNIKCINELINYVK